MPSRTVRSTRAETPRNPKTCILIDYNASGSRFSTDHPRAGRPMRRPCFPLAGGRREEQAVRAGSHPLSNRASANKRILSPPGLQPRTLLAQRPPGFGQRALRMQRPCRQPGRRRESALCDAQHRLWTAASRPEERGSACGAL